MRNKSIKKNYILNVIYKTFYLIVPLITTPYVSRILLPTGIGAYSYTFSLVNYFVLFAALGLGTYGQREIAKCQDNKKMQSKIFWEIVIVRLFSTMLSVSIYFLLCVYGIFKDYLQLMLWWSIYLFAQCLDISFLFEGNEDFSKIVFKNIFIKIIGICMIFLFVKKSTDTWIYVLCFAISTFGGNLIMWFGIKNNICKVKIRELKPKDHLWPAIKLFIPTIAVSIYTVLDKTLMGLLIKGTYIEEEIIFENGIETTIKSVKKFSDLENGYYEQSENIVRVALYIITALNTVMVPRNSNEIANGNFEIVRTNIYKSFRLAMLIGFPVVFGLIAVSSNFVPWFLGDKFLKSIKLIQLLAPLTIIVSISNIFGIQYLIPYKKDLQYSVGILIGAFVNLILNLILIPKLWSYGAVIGTLVAELIVATNMIFFVKKDISMRMIIKENYKYLVSSIIMFMPLYFVQLNLNPSIFNTFLIIIIGITIYFLCLLVMKDNFIYSEISNIIMAIKKKHDRR